MELFGDRRQHELAVADDDEPKLLVETDLLLHDAYQLASIDIEERVRNRERVASELLAKGHDRRAHPLHGHVASAKVGEKSSLDHLAPGHHVGADRFRAQDRL